VRLTFPDDITLIDDSWNSMQQTTSTLTKEANKVGLYINVDKCKLMTTSVWNDRSDIQAAGSEIQKVDASVTLAAIYHPTAAVRRKSKYELEKQQQYSVK